MLQLMKILSSRANFTDYTMSNKFKSPLINRWLTRSLFADVVQDQLRFGDSTDDQEAAMYWLNENRKGDMRLVLKDKFLELEDPTGMKLAKKWLGGWDHFKDLMKCKWFQESFAEWQDELQV